MKARTYSWERNAEEMSVAVQNPHRVDLGKAVERYRKRAGLLPKQLDERAGWTSAQKTVRVEVGKYTLSDADVDVLCRVLALSATEGQELRELAALGRKRTSPRNVASHAAAFIEFEQVATRIDMWSDELLPGLVQAPEYSAAILTCSGGERLAERVAGRMDRKKVLTRANPPTVRLLVGEAALLRPVGGPDALRGQLEHLMELRSLSSFDFRVFAFEYGADEALGSRFTIVDTPNSGKRVYLEGLRRALYVHKADDVAGYQSVFDRLWDRITAVDVTGHLSERIVRERIQQLT